MKLKRREPDTLSAGQNDKSWMASFINLKIAVIGVI
jgi:hypothetical protein